MPEYDISHEDLARIDRETECSLEQFKARRACQYCVCFDGRVCDLDGEAKNPDDSCTEFEPIA